MSPMEFPWPSQQRVRADYPTCATDDPCVVCGELIQPEQIYLVDGPCHIACSRFVDGVLVAERGEGSA